jgi:uncharacterized protein YndB with AHSA1/START domain
MPDASIVNDTIKLEESVGIPNDIAWRMFTEDFHRWYPREYSWSGADLETIGLEPRLGGRCFEVGPFGFQLDWGRILVWEPPDCLVFTWQISPDRQPVPNPDHAGEVEVRFEETRSSTNVKLEHRGFDRYQGDNNEYVRMMASEQGWPYILARFSDYCQRTQVQE